ncbi:MAG TPA: 3-isopropylmalate dehydratase small subunit [Buchnera sp. (in: enterobacteria)]|nr:3-isopropylmalate dehydratase small subunit [Buchnera sp. (in: enterobacteria)]
MNKLTFYQGLVVPIDMSNIDTDVIIPKQFLQKIDRTGFGKYLFYNWRFKDSLGKIKNPNFILNQSYYSTATILLTKDNFGCGSSREHAVWALMDYGFKAIIAYSFGDIFYNNSLHNRLIPIILSKKQIDEIFDLCGNNRQLHLKIDLINNKVITKNKYYNFHIDPFHKYCIINKLDQIDLTMRHIKKIDFYEKNMLNF